MMRCDEWLVRSDRQPDELDSDSSFLAHFLWMACLGLMTDVDGWQQRDGKHGKPGTHEPALQPCSS